MDSAKHLSFLKSIIAPTLDYFGNKHVNNTQFFCLGMLDRLLKACNYVDYVIKKEEDIELLEFSAGLTIRAILLDALIVINLYKLINDFSLEGKTEEEILNKAEEYCCIYLADGLDMTVNYIQSSKDAGILTGFQVEKAFNEMVKEFNEYFHPHQNDGSSPKSKYKQAPSSSKLFKILINNIGTKRYVEIYDLYLLYSKYDHFGVLYYKFQNISIDEKIVRLNKAVNYLIIPCAIVYEILDRASDRDAVVSNYFAAAAMYLDSYKSVQ